MGMFDDLEPQIEGLSMSHYVDHAGIPRAKRDDRPIIRTPCPDRWGFDVDPAPWCVDGRIPGARAGGKNCPTCKGKGEIWKAYSRATTFIDGLEDDTNVHRWRIRKLLRGLALSPELVEAVRNVDWAAMEEPYPPRPEPVEVSERRKEVKRHVNGLAEQAMQTGGVDESSDRGTHLHELTALVDEGKPLPDHTYVKKKDLRIDVTLQDRADIAGWRRLIDQEGWKFTAVERFVVLDELQIGGTLDRRFTWPGKSPCPHCDLPWVGDLKTGSVEYGGGKMPQQVAIYARSMEYDPETGQRTPQDLCTHRGMVINLVAGTGVAVPYEVDLEKGWDAVVRLSKEVRAHRNESRKHIWPYQGTAA